MKASNKPKRVSEVLRHALETCGLNRSQVSRECGIDQAVLSRFHHGGILSGPNVDRLADFLALELKPQAGKRRPDQCPEVVEIAPGVQAIAAVERELAPPRKRGKRRKGS